MPAHEPVSLQMVLIFGVGREGYFENFGSKILLSKICSQDKF